MNDCEPSYPPGLPCDTVTTPPAVPTDVPTPVPLEPTAGAQLVETGAGISPWLIALGVAVTLIGLILWRVTR